ncbi:MAG: phenylalanine--tRNA ligase subunit beta [Chloroflexi bacterium]|nr:phenylalanine--tRNA ligase subunit beta [Chloroflexota bacterium]
MKVPLSWLRELVDIDVPLAELRQRLTMAGLEVEELHEVGSDWHAVTLGRVVDLQPHPGRDGLHVAEVDLGGRRVTVVTAAPNLTVGDIVPHVDVGGRLPSGEVGRRAFAGITSEGMVCSGDELDISPDKEGIYLFEEDAPVGQPLRDYLSEVILDIYITANRPDCMSMLGIAREVHALFGAAYTPALLHLLDPATATVPGTVGQPPVGDVLSVRIDDAQGCPRFSASVLRGIGIGRSPHWLERRLHFSGVRPINNVVDVTNYVMLEVGQPLHAFDAERLGSSSIVVRRATPGERLRTLDGEERTLTSEMMVVTDGRRARSLAGIMGGEDSEISDATRQVVLEGASWDRAMIRRTSAALTLSSEASRRFGRGVDPDLTTLGVARATKLALELAGGSAAVGMADEYPGKSALRGIEVQPRQIDALLGMTVPRPEMVQTLERLGFQPEDRPDDGIHVTVPGWRRFDVEGAADLAEEVGRIAGFDRIPATMPEGALPSLRSDGDRGYGEEYRARQLLASAGLQEVITYSLVDPALARQLAVEPLPTADGVTPLRVANPQSTELSELRSDLLGSLLMVLRSNLRQRDRVVLFELARVWQGPLDAATVERRHVGIAMSGRRDPRYWAGGDGNFDFFDIKGVVDALAAGFHVDLAYSPGQHPSLHPGRTAEVCVGSRRLGIVGQLHPIVAERFDLGSALVAFAEIDFDELLQAAQPLLSVATPSRFPPADRDISFIVEEATPYGDIEPVIRGAAGDLLEYVELFDVFRGGAVPAGHKSLAVSLRYRAADRTLDDDEVSAAHGRVEEALRARFGAEVRGRA